MQHRISKSLYTTARFIPGAFTLSLLLLFSTTTQAQRATTSSPYSRYGLGEMRGDALPQARAMGGITTGIRYLNGYGNINVGNPASYSALGLTTIDVGL